MITVEHYCWANELHSVAWRDWSAEELRARSTPVKS